METLKITLFSYMEELNKTYRRHGQLRTAETYQTTLNSFRRFRQGMDLSWEEFDSKLLQDYECYLRSQRLMPNTISFYMRRLRSVHNKAVEEDCLQDRHPFKKVYTASEKTVKRAIPLHFIRQLKVLDLEHSPSRRFARDMFLLSFYLRGMSFVDMAYLRKKDLKNGVLTYRRRKTGQLLTIRWEHCMSRLAARYASSPSSPYLLNILQEEKGDIRRQYHNALTVINRHLKEIGREMKLPLSLTMYVARHSWASIAREKGIPISVISEGMGHDSESTTQIYLASLEAGIVDKANRMILGLL